MPDPGMTVAELLEQYPACASVLNGLGMACVGCELSAFETLVDAARTYGVEEGRFLEALKAVVDSTPQDR